MTITHKVPWRVASVIALPEFRLRVSFVDGTAGQVDMKAYLSGKDTAGTVFEPLRDPGMFGQVFVDMGAVSWPNGGDLAPDAMYERIQEAGVWVLD